MHVCAPCPFPVGRWNWQTARQSPAWWRSAIWQIGLASGILVCTISKTPVGQAAQPSIAAGQPIVLQLQWYPQAQFAGYIMARQKGFFAEAGLGDVELRWSRAGESPLEQLLHGKVGFCTSWLSTAVVRRAKGDPIVHLAQIVRRSTMMLVTHSNSGIRRPEDMTGRRVGLWGGDCDVLPTAFFQKYHVKPECVPQSNSMVPFLRHAVDVASAMHYNEYHKLLEAGLRREQLQIFLLSDCGLNLPEDALFTTEIVRRDRPQTCAAMVEAIRRGWDYALTHEAETLDAVMDCCRKANVHTSRNHQQWMLRSIGLVISPPADGNTTAWGPLSRATYDEVFALLAEQGLVGQKPAYEQFHQPPGPTRAAKTPDPH